MSETKTYVFGEGNNSQNNFDPNLLWGMLMGNGGFGGAWGGGMNFLWPFFLLFLWGGNGFGGWGNNGNRGGFDFLSSQINNTAGRDLLMQAINGNQAAINQLSSSLGCKVGDIQNALNALGTQICTFSGQVGMGQQQIINSLERGDAALANQMASCCCDIRTAIQSCCCDTQRAIAGVESTVTRGFADVGYAFRDQTCNIEKAISNSTSQILAGQAAIEKRELQREIATLQEEKQTYKLGNMMAANTAPLVAAINNLQSDVDGIKCKLPRTETVVAQPNYIPVNYGVNVGLAPYTCGYNYGCGFGLGSGYGYNGNTLWG